MPTIVRFLYNFEKRGVALFHASPVASLIIITLDQKRHPRCCCASSNSDAHTHTHTHTHTYSIIICMCKIYILRITKRSVAVPLNILTRRVFALTLQHDRIYLVRRPKVPAHGFTRLRGGVIRLPVFTHRRIVVDDLIAKIHGPARWRGEGVDVAVTGYTLLLRTA